MAGHSGTQGYDAGKIHGVGRLPNTAEDDFVNFAGINACLCQQGGNRIAPQITRTEFCQIGSDSGEGRSHACEYDEWGIHLVDTLGLWSTIFSSFSFSPTP